MKTYRPLGSGRRRLRVAKRAETALFMLFYTIMITGIALVIANTCGG